MLNYLINIFIKGIYIILFIIRELFYLIIIFLALYKRVNSNNNIFKEEVNV